MEKFLLGEIGKAVGVGFIFLLYLAYAIYLKISINNLAERMESIAKRLKEMVPTQVMDLKLEVLVAKLDAIKEDMGEIKELIKLNGKTGGRR